MGAANAAYGGWHHVEKAACCKMCDGTTEVCHIGSMEDLNSRCIIEISPDVAYPVNFRDTDHVPDRVVAPLRPREFEQQKMGRDRGFEHYGIDPLEPPCDSRLSSVASGSVDMSQPAAFPMDMPIVRLPPPEVAPEPDEFEEDWTEWYDELGEGVSAGLILPLPPPPRKRLDLRPGDSTPPGPATPRISREFDGHGPRLSDGQVQTPARGPGVQEGTGVAHTRPIHVRVRVNSRPSEHAVPPYSEIYGVHPRFFNFGPDGDKIPDLSPLQEIDPRY